MKYVNKRTKVVITCPIHGDFEMYPLAHAKGHGCQECGKESQAKKVAKPHYDKKELLRRLYSVHGTDKFDFSLIEDDSFVYGGVKLEIPVICKTCGTQFRPLAASMLSGSGCQVCRLKSFSQLNLGNSKPVEERVLVAGVGINDADGVSDNNKIYTIWREMIVRCYKSDYWKKRPTYESCEVCEEWKRFSNYESWYNEHSIDGFVVDKDLLSFGLGKKIYSPETCCFLPAEINDFLSIKGRKRELPVGVFITSGCITSTCGKNYLGSFRSVEEARAAYVRAKKECVVDLANKWKDKIEPRAYEALINLDVDKFFIY